MNDRKRDTIVIGFGSSALQDDGIPVWLIERLQKIPEFQQLSINTSPVGGLDLIAILDGYTRAVLIDTIKTDNGSPGEIMHFLLPEFSETFHLSSLHDVSFRHVLELAKMLEYKLPDEIRVIAIEIADNTLLTHSFSEALQSKADDILDWVISFLREIVR